MRAARHWVLLLLLVFVLGAGAGLTAAAFTAQSSNSGSGFQTAAGFTAWYDPGWSFRKPIAIDHARVAGDLTDFPVLISRMDVDLRDKALASGNDILFTAADRTTKLSHEIEEFDGATGELVAWVKVPSVSSTASTRIYMYYGNPAATAQQNVAGVWDSSHAAVWHLDEDPSGVAPQVKDRTSNARHGSTVGSMTSAQQVAGKIGGGLDFDNVDDRVDTSDFMGGISQLTVEAWVYSKNTSGDDRVIAKSDTTALTTSHIWALGIDAGTPKIRLATGNTAAKSRLGSETIAANTWTRLAFTYDGANLRIYKNGANIGTFAQTGTVNAGTSPVVIANNDTVPNDRHWNGRLDEVRLSTTARSAAWLATEYTNQSSPSTFYSVGAEQT